MKKKILLNVFSAVLTVLTVLMTVYYVLTPVNALFLLLTPIYYNLMRMIFVFRAGWFAGILADKVKAIRKILTGKVFKLINIVSVVLYIVFAVNIVEGCLSFDFTVDNSLINQSYSASEQCREVLPYYDYFGQQGGKTAYYDVYSSKMKKCSNLSVNNRLFELKVDSPSYRADYFKSNIGILLFKFRLEENLNGIAFSFFRGNEADKHYLVTEDGIKKEYMAINSSYSAVFEGKDYMCYIRMSNVDVSDITFYDFIETADSQVCLIDQKAREHGTVITGND